MATLRPSSAAAQRCARFRHGGTSRWRQVLAMLMMASVFLFAGVHSHALTPTHVQTAEAGDMDVAQPVSTDTIADCAGCCTASEICAFAVSVSGYRLLTIDGQRERHWAPTAVLLPIAPGRQLRPPELSAHA